MVFVFINAVCDNEMRLLFEFHILSTFYINRPNCASKKQNKKNGKGKRKSSRRAEWKIQLPEFNCTPTALSTLYASSTLGCLVDFGRLVGSKENFALIWKMYKYDSEFSNVICPQEWCVVRCVRVFCCFLCVHVWMPIFKSHIALHSLLFHMYINAIYRRT